MFNSKPGTSCDKQTVQCESNISRPNIGSEIFQYNVKWDLDDDSEEPNPTNDFIPNLPNINSRPQDSGPLDLYMLSLINSEMVPFSENQQLFNGIPCPSEKSAEQIAMVNTPYVPGVELLHQTIYPATSQLTFKDQRQLFRLLAELKKTGILPAEIRSQYQLLATRALSEEKEFQQFVKHLWVTQNYKRCLNILPSVDTFIQEFWKAKVQKCLSQYPRTYSKFKSNIPLILNDPNANFSRMDFQEKLFSWGYRPSMELLLLKKRHDLLTDLEHLKSIKPVICDRSSPTVCSYVPPVSLDEKVMRTLQEHNVDVVISSGTIKTLVVNQDREQWVLPVIVRNVLRIDGKDTVTKKVVFVDKKLPDPEMSVHDKNLLHAKITAKWALIANKYPHLFEPKETPQMSTSKTKNERELKTYDDIDFGSLEEEAEVDYNKKRTAKSDKQGNKRKRISLTGLNSKTDEGTNENLEQGEIPDLDCDMYTDGDGTNFTSERCFGKNLPRKKTCINPCLTYNLFTLHKETSINLIKQEQRDLKVLVRSRSDGIVSFSKFKRFSRSDTYISSKVEFQPEFGATKMTTIELLKEYIDLYLRPDHVLTRVRSVGYSKEVMLQEVKLFNEIKAELMTRSSVALPRIFDPLYSVLTKLIDLPEGKYMLYHCPRDGFFAQLLSENQLSGNFDMESYLSDLKNKEMNLPGGEIDPHILTHIHYQNCTPPALFRPSQLLENKKRTFLTRAPPKKERKKLKKKMKKKKYLKKET